MADELPDEMPVQHVCDVDGDREWMDPDDQVAFDAMWAEGDTITADGYLDRPL